jgi:Fe-S oxidoreductase
MRDDYRKLLPDDERVEKLAEATRLFEEALLELDDAELPLAEGSAVLLHGHCHQKALVGTGPTERTLALAPGTEVETVDSGCCGMAGLFGYEKGHYEVSMKMGERRLFPAGAARFAGRAGGGRAGDELPRADPGRHGTPRPAPRGVPGRTSAR